MERKGPQFFKKYILFAVPILVIIATLYLALFSKWRSDEYRKRCEDLNIIVITIDTLRWDYVSIYGQGYAQTPKLDRLAEEGILFKSCVAQIPLTLPSHTTILSGTYPLYHHVIDNSGIQVPNQLQLISEILRNHGFSTSAFIGSYVLHRKTGMNQGFEYYADEFEVKDKIFSPESLQKSSDEVLAEAKEWLTKNKKNKFFTWIHLFDPHSPYTPPSPYKERYPSNPYRGEVEYVDNQLGQFIVFLKNEGLYDQTLIIVTSDHGEGLGDHGEKEHGFFLYESTVRVPLILRAPFDFPVKYVVQIVEHVDIVPTILDLLDMPIPENCQGVSFFNLMINRKRNKSNIAFSETYYPRLHFGWSELKAFYRKNWKYIQAPREELYDLSQDIDEKANLALADASEREKMNTDMERFIKEKSANPLSSKKAGQLDKRDIDRLASLGYLTSVVDMRGKKDLHDPKDKIQIVNDLERAKKQFGNQQYDQAINLIKSILETDPEVIYAHHLLGNCYFQKKIYSAALENYRYVLKRQPDWIVAMYDVIDCLYKMGNYGAAVEETKKFLQAFPNDYILLEKLAGLYHALEEYDKSMDVLEILNQMDKTNTEILSLIVDICIKQRKYDVSSKYVEHALEIHPRLRRAHFLLGRIESAQGHSQKAIDLYKKELAIHPHDPEVYFYLAEELRINGNFPEANIYYRKTIELDPEFNVPYFIIAKYLVMKDIQLPEAIRLCKKGISIEPKNQHTLMGYSLLLQIYTKLGDDEKVAFYTTEARKLQTFLNRTPR